MKKPAVILEEFRTKLNAITDKKDKVREIVEFSTIYGDNYGAYIMSLAEEGIDLAKEIGDHVGEVLCFCHLGFLNRVTGVDIPGKYTTSLQELTSMVESIRHDPEMYSIAINLVSYFHWFRGEYERAFNLAFESFKINDERAAIGKAWNNFGLAVFYFDTKDFENSKKHYQIALDTFIEMQNEYGLARASNGLGTIAVVQNRTEDAMPLLEYSATLYRKLSHHAGLSRAVNDMGMLEKSRQNYPRAVAHLQESILLRKEINHVQGLITSYTELGETYYLMREYERALEQLQLGFKLANSIQAKQKVMRLHKLLYDVHRRLNKVELALHHFEKFFEVKSEILSDEHANSIKKVQTQFEIEKSERETELERFKNVELKKANAIIEQKNKDITDSINYARRIQRAILPPHTFLQECFADHFVVYLPKDIVSGDFYWASSRVIPETGQMQSIIAVIDCTGHGVPGAFMSMLGNTLLNQTILNGEVSSAADILNYLNLKLPQNLKSSDDGHIRDGMDMTLCIVDWSKRMMQFSGANNPCWLIRRAEIIELRGDKQAITASIDIAKSNFTNHEIDLQPNDKFYLFTDGIADQFGGPNEKKFGYKRLKDLLLANSDLPMEQQAKYLRQSFENWKGDLEQIDDVCMVGIKV